MTTADTIVVGAGGRSADAAGWPTIAWAVAEALVTRHRLLICHVCDPDSPLARYAGPVPMGALEVAEPSLTRAVTAARRMLGGNRVDVTVRCGHPGRELVTTATGAVMLVVGPPDPDWTLRPSISHHLVRHARCPLVVARPVADDTAGSPFAGHVVVGVDGSDPSRAALDFAFRWADTHRRPLAAVHVGADLDAAEPPGRDLLARELDRRHPAHLRVPVKRALSRGRPADGLCAAAAGARLLVVGNRGHHAAISLLLGSVAREVVDRAGCPVAVIHTPPVPATAPVRVDRLAVAR